MVQGRVKIASKPPVAHGIGVSGQPGGAVFLVPFVIRRSFVVTKM
jgi:hypothetical protein